MILSRASIMSAIVSLLAVGAVSAAPVRFGASLTQVQALYTHAVRVDLPTGAHALEVSDINYNGVRWGKIDFIFNTENRLTSLTMRTKSLSFNQALALAAREEPSLSGLKRTEDERTRHATLACHSPSRQPQELHSTR